MSASRTAEPAISGKDNAQRLSRRELIAVSGAAVLAGAALPESAAAAVGRVEGFFLVFDPPGGGGADDADTRVFFIPSRWLTYLEVTDAYLKKGLDPGKVVEKVRKSKNSKARKLSALYRGIWTPSIGTLFQDRPGSISRRRPEPKRTLLNDSPGRCSRDLRHSVHWVEHMRAAVEGRATSGARKLEHQRIRTAEETFTDLKPLFGAAEITRVADVTGLDVLGIPTVMVARPNSRAISVAQGKGLDIWAARTSGIMEALESFHAERLDWPVRLLTWRELSGSKRRRRSERAAKAAS